MKLLGLMLLAGASVLSASAQPVTPAGKTYTPAGPIEGYTWRNGVAPSDPVNATIIYNGVEEWEVENPMTCFYACEAFLGCTAFLYSEPRYKDETVSCRLLSDVIDPVVSTGTQLYLRNEPCNN